jgi:hypothetical protein
MEAEFGEPGYATIDVEALIIGPTTKIVEQVAFVLTSASTGEELLAEKWMVWQPNDIMGLCNWCRQPLPSVARAVRAYVDITHDEPVHNDPTIHYSWSAVRNRVRIILRRRAIKIYAKGAALERDVFNHSLDIHDLEDVQDPKCEKYPYMPHDPLEECRWFAKFIPELQRFRKLPESQTIK